MSYYSYAESRKNIVKNTSESIIEEIDILGFSLCENALTDAGVQELRGRLDDVWQKQVSEFGEKEIRGLGEWGQARAVLHYDRCFEGLILDPLVMDIVRATVGEAAILHCMNGSISFPKEDYSQSRWHRDFEKNFTSDKMLSVNAFWILDEFNDQTGATWMVPHSHKLSYIPSDEYLKKHAVQICAKAGSLLFFDSKLYHRAGQNFSLKPRRAVNLQYTRPFLKQQIDFPSLFKGRIERETPLGRVLGLWSVPPKDLKEFRIAPLKRTYKPGEG